MDKSLPDPKKTPTVSGRYMELLNMEVDDTVNVFKVVAPETSKDVRVPTEVREDETIFAPREVDPITVVPAIL